MFKDDEDRKMFDVHGYEHKVMKTIKSTKGLENQPKKIEKNQKRIKNKIKLKSPISKHHTTLLCNYYIGRGNQPKKIKKKSKKNQK